MFKMAPGITSGIAQYNTVMCLLEKIRVSDSDKLYSGMNYSAAKHKFCVKESLLHTQVSLTRKHTFSKVLYFI